MIQQLPCFELDNYEENKIKFNILTIHCLFET